MARRTLRWSARKNDIYDRGGLFMTRSEEAGRGRISDRHEWGAMEFVHCMRVCPSFADHVYLYRDLYMPQRAKK
jgi:hypothetical protein